MKVRDVVRQGSLVETLAVLDEPRRLCVPAGTIGCITGQERIQEKLYWEVSFPLPQAHTWGIMLYSEEHSDIQLFYQTHELRKVRGKEPGPLPLMIARFVNAGTQYVLYDVTRDERLHQIYSVVELGSMSFADLPVQAIMPREQVQQFCSERGWHLFYKEGDQPYCYKVGLIYRAENEEEEALNMPVTGTILASSQEEAHQRAIYVLHRDYPQKHFSGHELVQISLPTASTREEPS